MDSLSPPSPQVMAPCPRPQSELELMLVQLSGIEKWLAAWSVRDAAGGAAALTREMRLDLSRRQEARRREQDALVARAHAQLAASGQLLARPVRPRAVIAHRSEWLCTTVADRLQTQGVEIVGIFGDGAQAAGTLVAEQPDLLLVEDLLPTLPGVEVVQRARDYVPFAVVGVHLSSGAATAGLQAGPGLELFSRRVPPREIADRLVACVQQRG